jgi:hypothetical protein
MKIEPIIFVSGEENLQGRRILEKNISNNGNITIIKIRLKEKIILFTYTFFLNFLSSYITKEHFPPF